MAATRRASQRGVVEEVEAEERKVEVGEEEGLHVQPVPPFREEQYGELIHFLLRELKRTELREVTLP